MPNLYSCREGHQWEAEVDRPDSETCPECGAAGETVVQGDTLAPVDSGADELPPPPRSADCDPKIVAPPSAAVSPDELPRQFGRYQIVKPLGRGGMGAVYLAHDSQLDRQVALKVPRFRDDDAKLRARFRREAQAAATLDHPNICSVYDVGQFQGIEYLTMAYIDGIPLSKLIADQHPLPQRAVADLVRKLALALEEAHRQGVVHRDLKPENIMIKGRHEPVITDFGLARRESTQDARLTAQGAVMGTPAFMAPEQVAGDTQRIGPAADIYSLGVVLYELLTGRLPLEGSASEMLKRIGKEPPTPPTQYRSDIDEALESICLKALNSKPEDRFSSMGEFAGALEEFLRSSAGDAGAVDSAIGSRASDLLEKLAERLERAEALSDPQVADIERRRRSQRTLLVGAIAVVLLVGLFMWGPWNQTNQPPNQTVVRVYINVGVWIEDPRVIFLLNGNEISREALAEPQDLTVGEHEFVVMRDDKVVERRSFNLAANQTAPVVPLLGPQGQPGSFLHNAGWIEPNTEYESAIGMMQAQYFRVPVRAGQSARVIVKAKKTGYQPSHSFIDESKGVQTFSVAVYGQDFEFLGREAIDITGVSVAPSSWRLAWTAPADGFNYIAISASDDKAGLGGAPVPEDKRPEPAPYWVQVKTDQPGEPAPTAAATTQQPGDNFADAVDITASGFGASKLALDNAVFYRTRVKQGETVRFRSVVEKPWYSGQNIALWESSAEFTMTIYDNDQVEVAKRSLAVNGNVPDAQGPLEIDWQATDDGDAYVAISSQRTSVENGMIPEEPKPGRVALRILKSEEKANDLDDNPATSDGDSLTGYWRDPSTGSVLHITRNGDAYDCHVARLSGDMATLGYYLGEQTGRISKDGDGAINIERKLRYSDRDPQWRTFQASFTDDTIRTPESSVDDFVWERHEIEWNIDEMISRQSSALSAVIVKPLKLDRFPDIERLYIVPVVGRLDYHALYLDGDGTDKVGEPVFVEPGIYNIAYKPSQGGGGHNATVLMYGVKVGASETVTIHTDKIASAIVVRPLEGLEPQGFRIVDHGGARDRWRLDTHGYHQARTDGADKLMVVTAGETYDVLVDVGQEGMLLAGKDAEKVYAQPGRLYVVGQGE